MYSKLLFCVILLSGCTERVGPYLQSHTNGAKRYGDEYQIIVSVESDNEYKDNIMPDLLWAQKYLHESILPDEPIFYSINLYIAAEQNTYDIALEFIDSGPTMPSRAFCAITSVYGFVVVFAPHTWFDSPKEIIVEAYIHELTHLVAKFDGDLDPDHSDSAYWDKGGIVDIVYSAWLHYAKNHSK